MTHKCSSNWKCCLLALIATCCGFSVNAQEPVTITVTEPGTLYETLLNRDDDRIPHLILTGKLNVEDLKSLHQSKGLLSTVKTLDISRIEIEENEEEPYANVSVNGNIEKFFYSRKESRILANDNPDWYIPGYNTYANMTASLAGLFAKDECSYSTILMPETASPSHGAFTSNKKIKKIVYSNSCSEIGDFAFEGCSNLTEITIPERQKIKVFGAGCFRDCSLSDFYDYHPETIGEYAFENSSVTSIDLSKVTDMGECAFRFSSLSGEVDLRNLKNIPIYAFDKTNIISAIIDSEIETIGDHAFSYSALEKIELPQSLRFIGNMVFDETPFYKNFEKNNAYDNGILYLGSIAYASKENELPENVVIKEGCAVLASNLFYNCGIKTVSLPSTIKGIGNNTFGVCCELSRINLPEGLLSIGENAFSSCENLSVIDFPMSLTSIGDGAFIACHGLSSIKLHSTISELGKATFAHCSKLDRVYFDCKHLIGEPDEIHISNAAKLTVGPNVEWLPGFNSQELMVVNFEPREKDTPFAMANMCFSQSSIRSITLPANTASIPYSCFMDCQELKIVGFEGEAAVPGFTISDRAFQNCKALESVEIPRTLSKIGEFAFYSSGLPAIDLPAGVKSIGYRAFAGCLNGQEMLVLPSSLESAGYAFYEMGVKGVTIPKELAGNSNLEIYDCPNLQTVVVEEGAEDLAFHCEGYLNEIPRSVKRISGSIGISLKEVIMPDNLEEISGTINIPKLEMLSLPHTCLSMPGRITSDWEYNIEWRIPEGYKFEGDPMENRIERLGHVTGELTIPEGVGILGCQLDYTYNHFVTDRHINKISLPSTLKHIHNKSFYGCNGWTEITCHAKTPPALYGNNTDYFSWNNSSSVILRGNLYVPSGCADAYKENPAWARFEIYEFPEESGIEDIVSDSHDDIDYNESYDVYNLQGAYIGSDINITPAGVYILRQGSRSVKIIK